MPASITSPADVVNLALHNIGYKLRLANLYDGSEAANTALDIYAQTRDDALRDGNWSFAERNMVLELLKTAPANYFDAQWDPANNPPPPWRFEYTYPTDCLRIRQVKLTPMLLFNPQPQPVLWTDINDPAYTPPRRVIVCNIANAFLVYTGQVTDPALWPPDFVDALAAILGARLKRGLMSADLSQVDGAQVAEAAGSAMREQG